MSQFTNVKLPSNCALYDGVKPEDIQLRTFVGKEEEMLAQLSAENFQSKLPLILKEVVKGVEIEALTAGDHLFILIWEIINSYSNLSAIDLNCEHCRNNVIANIDLNDLNIIELAEGYAEPCTIKLPSGNDIKLRLLRVQDEINIIEYSKHAEGSSWLFRLATSIVDPQSDVMQRLAYLSTLGVRDVAKIRSFHEKFYHGVQLEVPYVCSNCEREGQIPLPFCLLDMLVPQGPALARAVGDAI